MRVAEGRGGGLVLAIDEAAEEAVAAAAAAGWAGAGSGL